jgi:hypothetical protein
LKLGGHKSTQAPAEEPAMPATDDLDFGGAEETPNAAPTAAPAQPAPAEPNMPDASAEPDESEEQSDPKKYIEKLTGKLGQSLRTYTQNQGQPDFELEKFAINSLLSATHTSEMDDSDKKDIINKVESSGGDNEQPSQEPQEPTDDTESSNDEDNNMFENSSVYENENFMLKNPKKNNMFQEGSNDMLDEACWKGYKQVGMKDKGGKKVPNCVKESESLSENDDRCTRIAKRKYDVWPSAYASGAVVKCRQGKIWKNVDENYLDELDTLKEKWSAKYKKSIDCNNPKGFSQKAHCQGKKKND